MPPRRSGQAADVVHRAGSGPAADRGARAARIGVHTKRNASGPPASTAIACQPHRLPAGDTRDQRVAHDRERAGSRHPAAPRCGADDHRRAACRRATTPASASAGRRIHTVWRRTKRPLPGAPAPAPSQITAPRRSSRHPRAHPPPVIGRPAHLRPIHDRRLVEHEVAALEHHEIGVRPDPDRALLRPQPVQSARCARRSRSPSASATGRARRAA